MKRSKLYHLFYNLPLNPPHSLWLASEFLNIPHHPASPLLTLPPPSSPICSSASPALCLYRGWWGISILAWSICSDVVQREGPALIYYTCQLNFWRYILIHKGWVLYAGCVSASLILISWCISDHAECLSDFFFTWWKTHCWWRFIIYSRGYEKDTLEENERLLLLRAHIVMFVWIFFSNILVV